MTENRMTIDDLRTRLADLEAERQRLHHEQQMAEAQLLDDHVWLDVLSARFAGVDVETRAFQAAVDTFRLTSEALLQKAQQFESDLACSEQRLAAAKQAAQAAQTERDRIAHDLDQVRHINQELCPPAVVLPEELSGIILTPLAHHTSDRASTNYDAAPGPRPGAEPHGSE